MNAFEFWLAPAGRVLVLMVQGWRPAFYDDARYAGWRVPMERPL